MTWLKQLPIRRKLTAFVLLISGAALAAALAVSFSFGIYVWRGHMAADLTALTQVVAGNAAGPLAFRDADAAHALLDALRARPAITSARLLDPSGAELARFTTGPASGPFLFLAPQAGQDCRVRGTHLYAAEPVIHSGEMLGTVQIAANLRGELTQLAVATGAVLLLVLAAALVLSYCLAAVLQKTITDPLFALGATARQVAQSEDYGLRARKFGDDEIGELTDAFNLMLNEVQHRDQALRRESEEKLRAQEQTRELERKFEQAQRLESLGVLAGGIAHDFNNILTGILCSASLGRLETRRGGAIDKHLERIEQSSRRAAELCEQMLAYAGKARADTKPIDCNVLARETLDMLHSSLPGDADLVVRLDPELPAVRGDTARLRQVLMNLLLNAAEALRPEDRRISLITRKVVLDQPALAAMSIAEQAQPGEFAAIEVSDTGVGIEPERLRRIFEPFHTSKFAGRGLGLSAVLGIIHGAGGALDVKSELGRGTTFQVFFPGCGEDAKPAQAAAEVAVRAAKAPAAGTVIVVDDEETVREVAEAVLGKMGFSVVLTADGAAAVDAVRSHEGPIAGVLLDLTMPGMDGVATLQEMRKLRPELKAVLMSGYDQKDTLPRLEPMGFSGFIQKPFTMQSLSAGAAVLQERT